MTYSKAAPVNYSNTAPLYGQSAPPAEEVTRLSKMGNLPGKGSSPGRSDVRQENTYRGYSSDFNAVAGWGQPATNRARVKDKQADGVGRTPAGSRGPENPKAIIGSKLNSQVALKGAGWSSGLRLRVIFSGV